MSLPFSLTINAQPQHFSQIRRSGFIICDLSSHRQTPPKRLGYCLNCKKLLSLSWAREHSRRLRNKGVNVSAFFKEDKVELYRLDIFSEAEILYEKTVSSRTTSAPRDNGVLFEPICNDRPETGGFDQPTATPGHRQHSLSSIPAISVRDVSECEETDPTLEQEIDCARECLLRDSFFRSEFHGDRFLSLAETVTNKLFLGSDEKKMNTFKARVITALLKKLSVILSLSKPQNEQMLSLEGDDHFHQFAK